MASNNASIRMIKQQYRMHLPYTYPCPAKQGSANVLHCKARMLACTNVCAFTVLRRKSASHPSSNGRVHTPLLQLMLPLLGRSLPDPYFFSQQDPYFFSQHWRPVLTDVSTPCRLQFVGRTPFQLEPATLHPTLSPTVLYLCSSQRACLCVLLPSSPHNCLLVCPCVNMEVVSARLFGLHLSQKQCTVRRKDQYSLHARAKQSFQHPGPRKNEHKHAQDTTAGKYATLAEVWLQGKNFNLAPNLLCTVHIQQ